MYGSERRRFKVAKEEWRILTSHNVTSKHFLYYSIINGWLQTIAPTNLSSIFNTYNKEDWRTTNYKQRSNSPNYVQPSTLEMGFCKPKQRFQLCIPEGIPARIMKLILFICFMSGTIVKLLPCEYIDGNPVPTLIFKGPPSMFHAFVISIVFAFVGAFSTLLTCNKPEYAKYEKFCRCYSLIFMSLAVTILLYTVSLACFRLVGQGMQITVAWEQSCIARTRSSESFPRL